MIINNMGEGKKILIIIDVQKGFITESNKNMLENINKLLEHARFDRIFATKFVNLNGSQYQKFLDWQQMTKSPDIDLAFDKHENLEIIEKTSYALPLNFAKQLKQAGSEKIYLCGTDYDACLLAIGFQLFDIGLQPIFIENCIGSANKEPLLLEQFEKIAIRNFGKGCLIKDME